MITIYSEMPDDITILQDPFNNNENRYVHVNHAPIILFDYWDRNMVLAERWYDAEPYFLCNSAIVIDYAIRLGSKNNTSVYFYEHYDMRGAPREEVNAWFTKFLNEVGVRA